MGPGLLLLICRGELVRWYSRRRLSSRSLSIMGPLPWPQTSLSRFSIPVTHCFFVFFMLFAVEGLGGTSQEGSHWGVRLWR